MPGGCAAEEFGTTTPLDELGSILGLGPFRNSRTDGIGPRARWPRHGRHSLKTSWTKWPTDPPRPQRGVSYSRRQLSMKAGGFHSEARTFGWVWTKTLIPCNESATSRNTSRWRLTIFASPVVSWIVCAGD